jgi:hypothetical protein
MGSGLWAITSTVDPDDSALRNERFYREKPMLTAHSGRCARCLILPSAKVHAIVEGFVRKDLLRTDCWLRRTKEPGKYRVIVTSFIALCMLCMAMAVLDCNLANAAELTQSKFRGWNSALLRNDLIQVNVTPQLGGRILGYQLGGHSFLWANRALQGQIPPPTRLGTDGSWLNWGGDKLWPAPQGWGSAEKWPGPPDPVLDGSPQAAKPLASHGTSIALELTSPKDPKTGIQFSRVIRIFDGSTRVHVTARMTNISSRPIRWGIWTVTQLDAGNQSGSGWNPKFYTFAPLNPQSQFPHGYQVLFGTANNPEIEPNAADRMLRLHYSWIVGKVGLDSPDGWLANVDGSSGYVFVQSFKFQPGAVYPDGSSVEVWTNGLGTIQAWGRTVQMQTNPADNPYIVESELVGPYARLRPGQQSEFSYDWYSANIGGNYPILSCGQYGCICQVFMAKRKGKQIVLTGRFGVFYQGYLGIEFVDARGQTVGTRKLLDRVSPLQPLVLESTGVEAPANAAAVRLVIYPSATEKPGELGRAAISR